MGNTPPAHRRLVPRRPKKKDPEDLEATSERVIHVDESSDALEVPRKLPNGSVDLPDADESMEMTSVRVNFVPNDNDDYEDMTAERVIEAVADEPPGDDFDDVGETSAHIRGE